MTQDFLYDDWLGPTDTSQIDVNLWMGACPTGDAPAQFNHFVALWESDELPYALRAYQSVTRVRMVDCEFVPNEQLLQTLPAIIEALVLQGPTLVHCQAGLNRSGLVLALVLMGRGKTARDAIAHLRKRRHSAVLCNTHFEQWLLNQKSN